MWKMFIQNMKNILANLPLVLSDSHDPLDISLNRCVTLLSCIFVFSSPLIVMHWYPELVDKFLSYWQGAATYLGAQMVGNIAKTKINNSNGGINNGNGNP